MRLTQFQQAEHVEAMGATDDEVPGDGAHEQAPQRDAIRRELGRQERARQAPSERTIEADIDPFLEVLTLQREIAVAISPRDRR